MIDSVELDVVAGSGGAGIVSFRREKFVPRGGPDGGDGGDGAEIELVADPKLSTLSRYHDHRPQLADNGVSGGPNRRRGGSGKTLRVPVPLGCEIFAVADDGTSELLADLDSEEATVTVARGGRGGRGNKRFTTATRQAPQFAQDGLPGQRRRLRIELKLLADVGLIGLPNAGKSTLLRAWSAATPKVASYPFTTLEPELGVVAVDYESFVAADMPGLIEGASAGVGLGHEFLRHIERTRVLVHVLDMTHDDPRADMELINAELAAFGHGLSDKPQLVALNKVDDPGARAHVDLLDESGAGSFGDPQFVISAMVHEGTDALARRTLQVLHEAIEEEKRTASVPVLRPEPRRERFIVTTSDGLSTVTGQSIERWANTLALSVEEALQELLARMRRMGIGRVLARQGVSAGDRVRIGDVEVVWEG